MNSLNEIFRESKTATSAILTDLSDGRPRSAKQLYERSEVLESRQEANQMLWELRQRGYVKSFPATEDISDPSARLAWAITDAGRAYLDESNDKPVENVPNGPADELHETPFRPAKQKKPVAKKCQCGGACGRADFNASGSKYLREVRCLVDGLIDVYAVLDAFGVTCPARQHAIKKLLCSGLRGKGSEAQDLVEARDAVERAIQMQKAR